MRFRRILTATVVVTPVLSGEHGETAHGSRGVPDARCRRPVRRSTRCSGRTGTAVHSARCRGAAPDHAPGGPLSGCARRPGRRHSRTAGRQVAAEQHVGQARARRAPRAGWPAPPPTRWAGARPPPRSVVSCGRRPRTSASGPSTARKTSPSVISAAGRARRSRRGRRGCSPRDRPAAGPPTIASRNLRGQVLARGERVSTLSGPDLALAAWARASIARTAYSVRAEMSTAALSRTDRSRRPRHRAWTAGSIQHARHNRLFVDT